MIERSRMLELIRFSIVGGSATATYIGSQQVLIGGLGWPIFAATTTSFAASLLLSYLGHRFFTFDVERGHGRYVIGFAVSTAILVVSSNIVVYACIHLAGMPLIYSSVIVGVLYPIGSYFLTRKVFADA